MSAVPVWEWESESRVVLCLVKDTEKAIKCWTEKNEWFLSPKKRMVFGLSTELGEDESWYRFWGSLVDDRWDLLDHGILKLFKFKFDVLWSHVFLVRS